MSMVDTERTTSWCRDGRHNACRGVLGPDLDSTTPCLCRCGCYRKRMMTRRSTGGAAISGEAAWKNRRTGDGVENNRRRTKATSRAQRRLAKLHPDEYRRLLDEERVAVGLVPAHYLSDVSS